MIGYIIKIGNNYVYDSIFKILGDELDKAKKYYSELSAAESLNILRRDYNLRILPSEIIKVRLKIVEVFPVNSR